MITPAAGWQIDPNNANRVIPIDTAAVNNPNAGYTGSSVVKGEPAVLSTVSGSNNFQTKIQPIIDTANGILDTVNKMRAERDAAVVATPKDTVPADVQAEIDANKTEEQKISDGYSARADQQTATTKGIYDNLTLAAHSSAQAAINSMTSEWQQRRQLLQDSNRQNEANWTQQFLRSGQGEYSPGMTGDFISLKEREGATRVKALDDDYNAKVAQINAAMQSEDFARVAQLSQDLQKIQDQSLNLIQANAKQAAAVNEKIRTQQRQVALDSNIATLVGKGTTDPAKILKMLNDGGAEVTADEVSATLKNLTVGGTSPANLPGDLAAFNYLKNTFGLPKDIAALPPEQQYFAYLQKIKGISSPGSTGGGNGYTALEQRKLRQAGISASDTSAADNFLYGKGGGASINGIPTWDEYLAAATKAAGANYLMAPDVDLLREQYTNEYGQYEGDNKAQPFTATEMKRLEYAGLLNATRKEQLKFLYDKTPATGATDTSLDLPPSLQ